jgi:hypothetical protein
MNPLVSISIGLREIAAHKFRTALSMLGIVLGVSSLIATMALTRGIEDGTRIFMQQMGGLELVSIVNKEPSSRKFEFANLSPGRTLLDAEAIRRSATFISHVSPEISLATAVATAAGVPFDGIWLEIDPAVASARVAARRGDASDADGAVVRLQATFDTGPIAWAHVAADGGADTVAVQAAEILSRH